MGLVLGVAGLAIFFVGGFFAFPLLLSLGCSIAAIFVGRNGVRKVDRGETSRNRGLGQAGFITGIVGTVLSVLGIVGWILLFVFLGEFTASFEQLEQDLDTDSFNVVLLTVAATALRSLGA